jgi:hypothetical protein
VRRCFDSIEQLELKLEELGAAEAIEEVRAIVTAERFPQSPSVAPPEHLPRKVHTRLPVFRSCDFSDCGGRSRKLGKISPRCWSSPCLL